MGRDNAETDDASVSLALRRLGGEAMTKEEALEMEGTGWGGDLDELRRTTSAGA